MTENDAASSVLATDAEVTTAEKMRSLPWAVGFSVTNQIFAYLTFFGPVVVLFFNRLGLSKGQIGTTLGILYITGIFSIFLVPYSARIGYKKTFLRFMTARALVVVLMLFVPWIVRRFGEQVVVFCVMAIVGLFAIFRTVALTGWMPWSQEYVPNTVRGKYTAINSIFTNSLGFLTVIIAGWVVGDGENLNNFLYLFAASFVFAALTVWAATHVPGGAPQPGQTKSHLREAFATLKNPAFMLFLLSVGLVTISAEPMNAFLPLYTNEQIGLSASVAIYIQAATMFGGILSSYLWGWAADRYGSKPVILLGLTLRIIVPVLWFAIPRQAEASVWLAMGTALFSGVANMGWAIGSSRMLFVSLVPSAKSGDYMAMWTTWGGITWAVSQVLGGWLLEAAAGVSGHLWIFEFDSYIVLFGIALIVPLVALFLLNRVHEADEEVSIGSFASLFFQGNPFMAMNAMIKFQRARDEETTVKLTEQLGQSRSPLTVEELLEAISDPRFNVRFEAIISIARREPDPRLISVLCTVLERDEPALGVVAAWALGRLGDPDALDSLRDALDAPYRSIQAHSARSLGTLQDETVLPLLTRRLAEEDDIGLKVAYTSALGKLRAEDAVPDILALLQPQEDRYIQLEIALALARIIGEEPHFINLMRGARSDPGTTFSQAAEQLVPLYHHALDKSKVQMLHNAAELFARAELDEAVEMLLECMEGVTIPEHSQTISLILAEARRQLTLHKAERVDIMILYFLSLLHAAAPADEPKE